MLVALIFAVPILAVAPVGGQSAEQAPAGSPELHDTSDNKQVDAAPSAISDDVLIDLTQDPQGAPAEATVNVEVHGPDLDAVEIAIAAVDGDAYGEVPGFFLEARILISNLELLAEDPAVTRVSPVTQVVEALSLIHI